MNNGRYDIVVIGGGSAGCVIAARLSANPEITVAVLEAGGTPSSPTDQSVVAWPTLLGGPTDWCYSTVPQAGLGNRVLTYARGKALGGSSTINAMAHLRGHKLDYDAWASAGAAGWAYADVLPWFRRSEDAPGRDTALRGIGGPMQAVTPSTRHPVAAAGLAAVSELGYPLSDDLSGNHQEGGTWLELNVVDGRRQTAFDAYLKPVLDRPNLTVIANAQVRSLIVTNGRCTGAEYVHDGELQQLSGAEIVLSAGSIGSPALLMLSGIGSAVDLERVGVPVVLDSPNVGRNLQDHPLSGVVYTSKYLDV
jgi:choline dehydrogenase